MRVTENVVLDLHRQLPRGGEDKPANGAELTAVSLQVEAVDHWQAEGRGFTGTCLRYTEDIMSG